ncbi:MAG: amino acid adenylation domain-containing protein [Tatlockia sp.]|nr:amino acid adenylation domain-containing protein [Tatlockia sp.]
MPKPTNFSCYFIGKDSLLIEFAEILLHEGHTLLGFVSTNQQVKDWAGRNQIRCFDDLETLSKNIVKTPPDFIFSFVNNRVIPTSILKHVKHFTINYHNALLPKYSGNHATSWAILNNEKQHGITWHVVTEVIDGGDILKQAIIPIAPNDTTLTLDLKCLEKALDTFCELIKELTQKNYILVNQPQTQRDYYALHQKPLGNGLIDWSSSAEKIDCLYRALNFSLYTNKLALPKFVLEQDVFIIQKLKVLGSLSTAPSGTLIKLAKNHLRIATSTNDIAIYKITRIEGQRLSIKDIIQRYHLREGYRFSSPMQILQDLEKVSRELAQHECYWVKKLNQSNDPINIPFDNLERLYLQSNVGFTKFDFQITTDCLKKYNPLDSKFILLTVIFIYFYRINDYQDKPIPINDYSLLEETGVKSLAIFFATYLPYTVHFHPEMSFTDAVQQVINQLNPQKEKLTYSRDIVMRYPSLREKTLQYPIAITIVKTINDYYPSSNYLINFVIAEDDSNLLMFVKNNLILGKKKKLFINTMMLHMKTLFNAVVSDDEQFIKKLPLLTKEDSEKILVNWNRTESSLSNNETLHGIIGKQAQKTPNHIAVIYENNYLTYSSLNSRANKLASYLRKLGVNDEEPIILCTNNSLELIIGLLGILKARGAYLPIDYNYNKAFIRHIIEDSNAKILITKSDLRPSLEQCIPSDSIINLISLDTDWNLIEKEDECDLSRGHSTDLAYIMYTSGSTGKPKGCLIEHKNVINLINDFQQKAPLTCNDIATLWTSIGFDVSIYEIFSPLTVGATLHLFNRKAISLDPYQYFKKLHIHNITSAYIPAFMLSKFLDWAKTKSNLISLKRLLVGVEPINENLLIDIQRTISNLTIINGYGPTETTVCSTLYVIQESKIKKRRATPIGKPIANTKIYILDPCMQPVPLGVTGELCISGIGLARGYLNKPELTQEKFVPNPYSADLNFKLYRTGDLACWLSDGNIEYHGRLDDQVKVRGFRIELNSIETCLIAHPAISQVVVCVETDSFEHKHLTAYIKLNSINESFNEAIIRNYLKNHLAEYMIPSVFFVIDDFPLTIHGKIDKKALLSINKQQLVNNNYVPAKTTVQQQLVEIWQEFFQINYIGISDNFFALGGHSLLVAEMFTRIYQTFNTHISLHSFLESPTISQLALQLGEGNEKKVLSANLSTFYRDIQLDSDIQPLSEIESLPLLPKDILLTGVTGFLGVHLLHELYHATSATIYCLIRAEDNQNAKNKLSDTLKYYNLSIDTQSQRIQVVVGDLAKDYLGLSNRVYKQLSEKIDAIYHNGAWVNHFYNYNILKPSNVDSTISVLKLASIGKPKLVHYFSTLSAHVPQDKEKSLLETFPQREVEPAINLLSGYEQTKWVSECLLAEAHQRGFAVTIFRLGWIGGQEATGICAPETNHFLLFLKGCIQLGFAPNRDNQLDILPVDIASHAIISISLDSQARGQVFHISNPSLIRWTQIIDWVKEAGYHVKLVSPTTWHQQHLKHIDRSNALYPFLPLYTDEASVDWLSLHEFLPKIDISHTDSLLRSRGICHPAFSKKRFDTYLSFLQNSGFL